MTENQVIVIEAIPVAEVASAIAILEEAAAWLLAKGIPTWQPKSFERSVIPASERGELYLAKIAGQPAGTFILQWSDEPFWGKQPPDAGYIHKLATRREFAGRNVGKFILDWAARKVVASGREFLRLDCQASNPVINKYYQEAGFILRGRFGDQDWNLYEKKVTSL